MRTEHLTRHTRMKERNDESANTTILRGYEVNSHSLYTISAHQRLQLVAMEIYEGRILIHSIISCITVCKPMAHYEPAKSYKQILTNKMINTKQLTQNTTNKKKKTRTKWKCLQNQANVVMDVVLN